MDLQELAQVLPKNIVDWSVQDVIIWLKYIRLSQFEHQFRQLSIDGAMLLLMNQQEIANILRTKSQIITKKVANWIAFLNSHSRNYQTEVSRVVSRSSQTFQQDSEEECQSNNMLMPQDSHHWQSQGKGKTQKKELLTSTQKSETFIHQTLYVHEKFGQQNRYYSCNFGKNMTIGKSAENFIILNQLGVQLNHCIIYHRKSHHFIKARRGSGVWIKIKKGIKIDRNFIIQMGNTQFGTTIQSNALRIYVTDTNSNEISTNYTFCPSNITNIRIGRSTRYELAFPTDSTMSGFHGRFSYLNNSWYFEDMQTLNGSWYRCTEDLVITNELTFRLGKTSFIYQCRFLQNQEDQQTNSTKSKSICIICRKAQKNSYFNPCHHCITCEKCAVVCEQCIYCGWKIMSVERMFRA